MSNGIVIIGSGLRRPPTGEKYSQTGRQYSINSDCRRQHG